MNRAVFIPILLFCFAATGLPASEKPKHITKEPDEPLNLPQELVMYYTRLTETDADVQKQVARLTARSRQKAGGLFKRWEEPRAVEWLPFSETRSETEGDTVRGRFLVIQLAGRWRTKDSDADMALTAEFDVHYDGRNGKLTMTFLGFRKLMLAGISTVK
jgi:hypothetical protein